MKECAIQKRKFNAAARKSANIAVSNVDDQPQQVNILAGLQKKIDAKALVAGGGQESS